eukprot:Opistho-2@14189
MYSAGTMDDNFIKMMALNLSSFGTTAELPATHPDMPLPFETISGRPYAGGSELCAKDVLKQRAKLNKFERKSLEACTKAGRFYRNGEKGYEAAIIAMNGYRVAPDGTSQADHCAKIAAEALAKGGGSCPEAHLMLGWMTSKSFEEAIAHFSRAVADADANLIVTGHVGTLWDAEPLRPLYRSIHHLGNALRKSGQMKQALAQYLRLVSLDNRWINSSPPYANFRYHIPEVYLALKDIEGLKRFTKQHCEGLVPKLFSYTSSCLPWSYGWALLKYMEVAKAPNFSPKGRELGSFVVLPYEATAHGVATCVTNVILNSKAIPYLSGEQPLPDTPAIVELNTCKGLDQALMYAKGAAKLWQSIAGATQWLKQQQETFMAIVCCEGRGKLEMRFKPNPCASLPKDIFTFAFFERIMKSGSVYLTCPLLANEGKRMLHMAIMGEAATPSHVALVIDAHKRRGLDMETDNELTPMHMACYYDAPPPPSSFSLVPAQGSTGVASSAVNRRSSLQPIRDTTAYSKQYSISARASGPLLF